MSELDETTRRKYLKEMGITIWSSRALPTGDAFVEVTPEKTVHNEWQKEDQAQAVPNTAIEVTTMSDPVGESVSEPESVPEPLPIEAFIDDIPFIPAGMDILADTTVATSSPAAIPAGGDTWEGLLDEINHCEACPLCKTRNKVVAGVGDQDADWLFIGEGPGFHEDEQGEPFVGRSGQLLDSMLAAMHIKRGEKVYIANVVKCRASNESGKDRQPTEEEAAFCMPYLERQIRLIKPKIMVALGKTAACALLNTSRDVTLGSLRNKTHVFKAGDREIPLVVTYHPSYLLRTPGGKKQAWQDLCMAMDLMDGIASGKK